MSSRDIEAILLSTAPPMRISVRRVGDEGSDDVARWSDGSDPGGQGLARMLPALLPGGGLLSDRDRVHRGNPDCRHRPIHELDERFGLSVRLDNAASVTRMEGEPSTRMCDATDSVRSWMKSGH